MFNIITKSNTDPKEEFRGLWLNKDSGSIWIWTNRPTLLGFAKDSKMISIDTFEADFVYTAREKNQKYEYEFKYSKMPTMIIATLKGTDYDGGEVVIENYGSISGDGTFVVAQRENVKLGENLKIKCIPTKGSIKVNLTILSYE